MIYKIKRQFTSFRFKLIIIFLLGAIIPSIVIAVVGYKTSYKIAENKIAESVSLSNTQLVQQVNDRFTQMVNVLDSAQNYSYTLDKMPQEPLDEYLNYFGYIRNHITTLMNNFNLFQISIFLGPDKFVSNEGLMFYRLDQINRYHIFREDITNLGISSKWFFRHNLNYPQIISNGKKDISSIIAAQSFSKDNMLESATFSIIRTDELNDLLLHSFSETPINSFILTPDYYIAAHKDSSYVGSKLDSDIFKDYVSNVNQGFFIYDNQHCLVSSLNNDFYLVTQIPQTYIQSNIKEIIHTIFVSILFIIPSIIFVVLLSSNTLTKKLRNLSHVVNSTVITNNTISSQNFDSYFNLDTEFNDDIDQLALNYLNMTKTIENSFNEILNLSVQKERLNYQLLQSQINPHFLYNILNSIHNCQTLGKVDIANQMIMDLSKFYRILLRKNNDLITIEEEIEIINLYLEMEYLCQNGSLTWEVYLDEGIEGFIIPKFTLQPILENCIKHGMNNGKVGIHVSISILYKEDTILITITDNGIGIPDKILLPLQYHLAQKIVDTEKNFGLCNVNARISHPHYGSGQITISSILGEGTQVSIEFQQMLAD